MSTTTMLDSQFVTRAWRVQWLLDAQVDCSNRTRPTRQSWRLNTEMKRLLPQHIYRFCCNGRFQAPADRSRLPSNGTEAAECRATPLTAFNLRLMAAVKRNNGTLTLRSCREVAAPMACRLDGRRQATPDEKANLGRAVLPGSGGLPLRQGATCSPYLLHRCSRAHRSLTPGRRRTRRFFSRHSRSSFLWFITMPSRASMIPSRR
jgi:hypothetical protein